MVVRLGRWKVVLGGGALLVTALAMSASPSDAAFPGGNGKIAFDSSRFGGRDVFVQGLGDAGPRGSRTTPPPTWTPCGRPTAHAWPSGRIATATVRST